MPDRMFGHVPGVTPGSLFPSRTALSKAGVHRPTQAGIGGGAAEGAESIVLSDGYEDDQDLGTEIVYTGQGGRDPNTGKQMADQDLTRGNLALAVSHTEGLPVRVVRLAPEGYRYYGLYRVVDHWHAVGKSGFKVWRYRLIADENGTSDPIAAATQLAQTGALAGNETQVPVPKRTTTVTRVVRDTAKSRDIKKLYCHRCQVCDERLEAPGGPYAEGAHIRPLGAPHNGPDTYDNIICLCPNHHVLFDLGSFTIADDLSLIGLPGKLYVDPKHSIGIAHLQYHREHYLP